MNKYVFLFIIGMLQAVPARLWAARTVETLPGQLQHLFDVYYLMEETDLTIKGKINGTDIKVLREWANIQKTLNLSDCRIVAGGEPYYKDYTTEDDAIGPYMFREQSFKSLVLPNTLKKIGDHAFKYCGESLVLPPALEWIGDYAFESTGSSIVFPSSLTWIGDFAFANNSLERIHLPASLVHIGNGAFNGWPWLSEATIDDDNPAFVVEDGYLYTRDHTRLLSYFTSGYQPAESFTLHPEVRVIDDKAFNCRRAYNITLNDKLEHIGNEAFRYVLKDMWPHQEKLVIPNSVTFIGEAAFEDCQMDTLIISDNVEYLPDRAFQYCQTDHIHLPAKLKHIGKYALYDNYMYNLVLPDGLETVEGNAFGRLMACRLVIPKSVRRIDEEAFADISVDTIDIQAPLETISNYAFSNCPYTKKLILPPTVKRIGMYAFSGSDLTDCKLPDGLEEIGIGAFAGAAFMEEWHIPASVRKIDESAFESPFFAVHTVYMYSQEPPANTDRHAFNGWPMEECTLYVPQGCTERYKQTAPWNTFGTILEFNPTSVKPLPRTPDNIAPCNFDLNGRPILETQRGLRIVKTADGVRKVMK